MRGFTPDEWHRLGPLLDQALDLDRSAREAFLEHIGNEDQQLKRSLDELIAAASFSDGFLDVSGGGGALALMGAELDDSESRLSEGSRVGPYRILRELGSGGMGRVYSAERADGLWERKVALKLVRRDLPSAAIMERFLYERRILARLDHPNIARLLDGGATQDGQPYFAMELVEGQSLLDFCDGRRLSIDQRLELFTHACDAVQYAHQSLVIHRDLKPSNIQITESGQLKLLDFGIAKLLSAAGDASQPTITLTQVALPAMTPEYAAPEQLLGKTVTTATDVYSLGVVLYELLTGHRPYRFERQTPAEIERVVCGQQPIRPSAAVTRSETIHRADGSTDTVTPEDVADARSVRPDRLKRHLRGDLELIVLRALQKDPQRRYPTADSLARDIRNFREDRPVVARPEGLTYRLNRFVARNKAGVAAAALLTIVLAGGIWTTLWQASVASSEAAHAGNVKSVVLGIFDMFDPETNPIDSLTGRDILEAGVARAESDLTGQPDTQAELFATFGTIYTRLSDYERGLPLLERAVQLRRRTHPRGDSVLATMIADLGLALSEKGEFAEAEELHQEAFDIRTQIFGTASPQVSRSVSGIASVLRGRGEFDEAIARYEEVLERDLSHYGESHEYVAEDLGELAETYRGAGRPREARPYAEQALTMRIAVSGEEHVETATARNNLGTILLSLGDLDGADSLFRAVLEFDQRRFGDKHQYTATVKNNLAVVRREKGDLVGAEALFRDVVDYDIEELGRRHRYTPIAMTNLLGVLRDQGSVVEAEGLGREALEINMDLYGERHVAVAGSWASIGSVQLAAGRPAAAEVSYLRSLEIFRAADSTHSAMATAETGLGETLLRLGKGSEAVAPLTNALVRRLEATGEGAAVADTRALLGQALMETGDLEQAEEELAAALQSYRVVGWPRRHVEPTQTALARLFRMQGRESEASALERERALATTAVR